MKANELMIGDWVKDKYKPKPHKVDSWADFNNAEDLSPIPLTSEILEKNEFETKFGYSKYNDKDDFFLVTWNSISHHLRVRTFDNDCAFDKDHINYYVHELQHALRLCGLNDLADNFKVE